LYQIKISVKARKSRHYFRRFKLENEYIAIIFLGMKFIGLLFASCIE